MADDNLFEVGNAVQAINYLLRTTRDLQKRVKAFEDSGSKFYEPVPETPMALFGQSQNLYFPTYVATMEDSGALWGQLGEFKVGPGNYTITNSTLVKIEWDLDRPRVIEGYWCKCALAYAPEGATPTYFPIYSNQAIFVYGTIVDTLSPGDTIIYHSALSANWGCFNADRAYVQTGLLDWLLEPGTAFIANLVDVEDEIYEIIQANCNPLSP